MLGARPGNEVTKSSFYTILIVLDGGGLETLLPVELYADGPLRMKGPRKAK
ncbi:hypothetical protein JOE21_001181 [Desmospora profundinema]|uniref:Uncharacterized protein n=1 Tax=Desmospora profundinema TaxID=1571184 RepID=A0ABU1IN28_9BACL|nr:hypothetical protein [Desmospora profundinema]